MDRLEIRGGKTGTATMVRQKYLTHGWNVILFRYDGEPYVLVTFVEKGIGGREAKQLSSLILSVIRSR